MRAGALCAALPLLAACGGGGGGGAGVAFPLPFVGTEPSTPPAPAPAPVDPPAPAPAPVPALSVDCAGVHCGAVAPDRYAGSGVGVWRFLNDGTETANVPVAIQGVQGREVTLIYANPTPEPVAMPVLRLEASAPALAKLAMPMRPRVLSDMAHRAARFDPASYLRRPRSQRPAMRAAAPPRPAQVGDRRQWFVQNQEDDRFDTRAITLRQTITAMQGRVVQLWVEDDEYGEGKVTAEMVDKMARRFAQGPTQIYRMATYLAGEPWGEHPYDHLIGPSQPLDIVFYNFDRNRRPYGMLGVFMPLNNFLRDPDHDVLKYSNESLAFMMDTETLYLGNPQMGMQDQMSALAHELTHAINFYQRGVLMWDEENQRDYGYASFLEETTAVMMEDLLGYNIDPDYHVLYHDVFPRWLLDSLGNCSYTRWVIDPYNPCTGYNVGSSFGGYLLRHYGVAFYRNLLRNKSSTDSLAVLDDAIRRSGGPGFAEAWRRWGTMAALPPDDASPAGFGMPGLWLDDRRFWLPPIPREVFLPYRVWPSPAPAELLPHAQFPLRRTPVGDRYEELLSVPPGVALTVVVQ